MVVYIFEGAKNINDRLVNIFDRLENKFITD